VVVCLCVFVCVVCVVCGVCGVCVVCVWCVNCKRKQGKLQKIFVGLFSSNFNLNRRSCDGRIIHSLWGSFVSVRIPVIQVKQHQRKLCMYHSHCYSFQLMISDLTRNVTR